MGNIFSDIKTAVKLTAEVRRARETGQTVEVRPVHTYAHWNVKWVYNHLPYEDRRRLEFSPVNAGWVDRARFWQRCLKPALTPRMYHHVMVQFLSEYVYRQRLATGVTV